MPHPSDKILDELDKSLSHQAMVYSEYGPAFPVIGDLAAEREDQLRGLRALRASFEAALQQLQDESEEEDSSSFEAEYIRQFTDEIARLKAKVRALAERNRALVDIISEYESEDEDGE